MRDVRASSPALIMNDAARAIAMTNSGRRTVTADLTSLTVSRYFGRMGLALEPCEYRFRRLPCYKQRATRRK